MSTTRALLGAGALLLIALALPFLSVAFGAAGMRGWTGGAVPGMGGGGMMGPGMMGGWAWWALLPAALLLGWAALKAPNSQRSDGQGPLAPR